MEGKKGKRKSIKRRVEEAAREVLVGNISRPCHFSNSGSCIPDIRAKCPRFSRVHSSDREADSVSINYTRQIPPASRFLFIHRGDGLLAQPLSDRPTNVVKLWGGRGWESSPCGPSVRGGARACGEKRNERKRQSGGNYEAK